MFLTGPGDMWRVEPAACRCEVMESWSHGGNEVSKSLSHGVLEL